MPKQKPNEQVQQIPLSEIRPFKNHPFKVTDDELMQQTIDSIMQVGVLNPAIIRPAPEGGYEMVAGHRRLHAADLAGLKTIPAIVRNLDDDEAVILMVDSNLQRETISPMERAQAYKMKLEALKHQGKRRDLTSSQVGTKLNPFSRPDAAVLPALACTQTLSRSEAGLRAANCCPRRGSPPHRRQVRGR